MSDLSNTFAGDPMSGLYSFAYGGWKTQATCPECGKGLNQDDAYGHDCEV